MNERRVLLASLLSVVCISLYSQTLMRKSQAPATTQAGGAANQEALVAVPSEMTAVPLQFPQEDTQVIETEHLKCEIGMVSGTVRSATLKRFQNSEKTAPLMFKQDKPLVWFAGGQEALKAQSVNVLGRKASVVFSEKDSPVYEISYELELDQPVLNVAIRSLVSGSKSSAALNVNWLRGDALSSHQNRLEAYVLSLAKDKAKHKHFGSPWKGYKNVPRGTLLALADRHFCLVAKPPQLWESVQMHSAKDDTIGAQLPFGGDADEEAIRIYIGARDYHKLRAAGFEKAFPIGILGQIGLALLLVLSWLAGISHSYGIAIILFSVLVTVLMAPFTLLSFRSMKRMQELKPQVDKIMAQHKSDPQKANKEVFELYKVNKVSPLGGCLPMLLQMPIFIALFQAITHFVELRGATFLLIKDLSLPDGVIPLPTVLPFVGNTINVLPIIMAAAMYFQTQASQKNMGQAADNPTAQMMSGPIMPVLFLFMFYQFPAGLVLYWLTNSIMSMLLYKVANK